MTSGRRSIDLPLCRVVASTFGGPAIVADGLLVRLVRSLCGRGSGEFAGLGARSARHQERIH